ncbi:uncharacterized protein LOC122040724 [Zingiber officinale]|uniref:uncharacterized protein LOC122040724 n=1 Tax=Zingiber officinale TaxID=94328 RepID=UPI001C4B2F90|nr:uncharacterized protein LOC122040724 [Zingiber officinale]
MLTHLCRCSARRRRCQPPASIVHLHHDSSVTLPRPQWFLFSPEAMEALLRPLQFRCLVQNSDWGCRREDLTVAHLFEGNSGTQINLSRPYTEFWMGTHCKVTGTWILHMMVEDG